MLEFEGTLVNGVLAFLICDFVTYEIVKLVLFSLRLIVSFDRVGACVCDGVFTLLPFAVITLSC